MGAILAFITVLGLAFTDHWWGPKLAEVTGWKWPLGKWRVPIGVLLVYLTLLTMAAIFAMVIVAVA